MIYVIGYVLMASIVAFILLVISKKRGDDRDNQFFVAAFGGTLWPVVIFIVPIAVFFSLFNKAANRVAGL